MVLLGLVSLGSSWVACPLSVELVADWVHVAALRLVDRFVWTLIWHHSGQLVDGSVYLVAVPLGRSRSHVETCLRTHGLSHVHVLLISPDYLVHICGVSSMLHQSIS